jgi:NAD(P) transhydrogenase
VTLVEKRGRLVGFMDAEMAASLRQHMQKMGVRLLLSDSVATVQTGTELEVRLQSGAVVNVQTILVSSGRCGNVDELALDKAGIAPGERGQLNVNQNYQTEVPHIYAAGDVIGFPALASTSMEQSRVAMVHAFDLKYREGMSQVLPYGIYTIPECSMVGATEESLTEQKVPYVVGRASYASNARGQIVGDTEGLLKLVFRAADMKLLGVHMIGEGATEIVHIGLTALLLGAGADLFVHTCYNYPTLSELYKYAAYDALGRKQKLDAGGS